jgi:histidinol-phosphatase (PHP family)
MYLTDFHMHSRCSQDAHDTMADMAAAARDKGIRHLCFTDHCDLDAFATGKPDPDCFRVLRPKLETAWAELRGRCPEGLEVGLGLELGEASHDPEHGAEIASWEALDFVIGSTHNLRNCRDFYCYPYHSLEECYALRDRYFQELTETARLPFVDVIGHIGYLRRYIAKAGYPQVRVDMASCGDQVDTLLRTCVETGRGIECNCSGLRNADIGETIPGADILRRYRELGGEIITLGSDSHCTADAGAGIREGHALLRELGYRYITVFRRRKPEFIPIDA